MMSVLVTVAAVPARADGTLGLGEVIAAVAAAPKLVSEIQAELDKNKLRAAGVTCLGARHGNHWKYLGGGRAAPYRCEIGRRSITIEAERNYFDARGRLFHQADPKRATTFREDNFHWTWMP